MLEPAASSPGAALLRLRTCIAGVCYRQWHTDT